MSPTTKMSKSLSDIDSKSYLKPTLSVMSVPSDLFNRKPLTEILRRSKPPANMEKLLYKIQLTDQLKAELLAKLKIEQMKREKLEEKKARLKERKLTVFAPARKTQQLSEEERELKNRLRSKTNELKQLRTKILDEQMQSIAITQLKHISKKSSFKMSKSLSDADSKSYLKPTLSIMSVPSELFNRKPLTEILRRSKPLVKSNTKNLKKKRPVRKDLLVIGCNVTLTENMKLESDKFDLADNSNLPKKLKKHKPLPQEP